MRNEEVLGFVKQIAVDGGIFFRKNDQTVASTKVNNGNDEFAALVASSIFLLAFGFSFLLFDLQTAHAVGFSIFIAKDLFDT